MKLLKALGSFVLAHLPRWLRTVANHASEYVDECDYCDPYPCDECPYRKEVDIR